MDSQALTAATVKRAAKTLGIDLDTVMAGRVAEELNELRERLDAIVLQDDAPP